jgi:hypothetical protein
MMSRDTNRTMFVLSGPASGRSVVISTIRRLPPLRSASNGWSSPPRTAARSASTSSSFSGVRPGGERRVLGTLQLRGGHELHRPRDLLDVADAADAAADIPLARHQMLRRPLLKTDIA